MAWDAAAKSLAANVIAKVEGAGAWDAINYHDAFTIGLMQWYGPRALGLLVKIKAGHPTEYNTLPSSIKTKVTANNPRDAYWTTHKVTGAEGVIIKPVLRASKDSQSSLLSDDLDDYLAAAARIGLNKDTQTKQVQFFMVMYHQTPARAVNIVGLAGASSSLSRLLAVCLNDRVFGQYKSRYNSAYNYINTGTSPEIVDLNDDNEDIGDSGGEWEGETSGPDGDGSDSSVFDKVRSGIHHLEVHGDQILIRLSDGGSALARPTTGGNFILSATYKGVDVPPATPDRDETAPVPDPNPDPPTGNEATDTQNKLVKFMMNRRGKYAYSQAAGRLTPDKSRYTDCSALVRFCYLTVTGKDVGTYTDAQVTNKNTRVIMKGGGGDAPDESKMMRGDLVITASRYTAANRLASHVEIYMGNNQTIGHGGPMAGPIVKPLRSLIVQKKRWWVKRLNGL